MPTRKPPTKKLVAALAVGAAAVATGFAGSDIAQADPHGPGPRPASVRPDPNARLGPAEHPQQVPDDLQKNGRPAPMASLPPAR